MFIIHFYVCVYSETILLAHREKHIKLEPKLVYKAIQPIVLTSYFFRNKYWNILFGPQQALRLLDFTNVSSMTGFVALFVPLGSW